MKKSALSLGFIVLSAFFAFAQSPANKLIGTWKIAPDGKTQISKTIIISEDENHLLLRYIFEDSKAQRQGEMSAKFKKDESSIVETSKGRDFGTVKSRMSVLGKQKFSFETILETSNRLTSSRDNFEISDDGIFLYVEKGFRSTDKQSSSIGSYYWGNKEKFVKQ